MKSLKSWIREEIGKHLKWIEYIEYNEKIGDVYFDIRGEKPDIIVGKHSYGLIKVHSYQKGGTIKIGNYTSISEITLILGGNHHRGITTFPFKVKFKGLDVSQDTQPIKEIKIGSDCWIGLNAIILDGVEIRDGTIIGAGSVVAKSTDPYGIYVGNPARKIGSRFDESSVDRLLKSRWWDYPDEIIEKLIDHLYDNNVDVFLSELEKQTAL